MRLSKFGALALAGQVCLLAASYDNTQQKSFPLSGSGERRLIVENIQGNIRVVADSGSEVRITAKEHYTADTESALSRARTDVRLEMVQTGNVVKVSLEGPFRDRDRNSWRQRRDEDDRYNFRHDFEVSVPRDIAGFGRIKTVNGGVKASFRENPAKPVLFETINGELDATFQPGLNADVKLSTMHGDVFTDFDVQTMAMPVSMETKDGGKRIRIDRDRGIKVGNGGIEHSFKTLNGSIKIRKSGNSK